MSVNISVIFFYVLEKRKSTPLCQQSIREKKEACRELRANKKLIITNKQLAFCVITLVTFLPSHEKYIHKLYADFSFKL